MKLLNRQRGQKKTSSILMAFCLARLIGVGLGLVVLQYWNLFKLLFKMECPVPVLVIYQQSSAKECPGSPWKMC